MEFDLATIALLVLAAFAAGFVDSIAGGGGMISLPALLLAGMPPVEAVATNKLQATFGSTTAGVRYWRAGLVDLAAMRGAVLAALAGGGIGSLCLGQVDAAVLSRLIPLLLIAIALYFAFAPKMTDEARAARLGPTAFALGIAAPIGFYDGMFGPGTGSFFAAGLVTLAGLGLLAATAQTKILNTASNVGSLVMFMALGHVTYAVGLPMAVGQALGAQVGSSLAVKHGAGLIRPLLVVVTILVAIRLLMR
jgi:hypothetical protein